MFKIAATTRRKELGGAQLVLWSQEKAFKQVLTEGQRALTLNKLQIRKETICNITTEIQRAFTSKKLQIRMETICNITMIACNIQTFISN